MEHICKNCCYYSQIEGLYGSEGICCIEPMMSWNTTRWVCDSDSCIDFLSLMEYLKQKESK